MFYKRTREMIILFLKGIIIFEVIYRGGALYGYGEYENENNFVTDIMKKIEKIADEFSRASIDERSELLLRLEEKLRKAAMQSFANDGAKYVDLIMQGVKLKAFNDTMNASESDKYDGDEHIIKDHVTKKITDQIEAFVKKYLLTVPTIEDKRIFLDNVRKKMLETAQAKHLQELNGDIASFNNVITNSLNEVLKRNLAHYSRRSFNNVEISQENVTQNTDNELLEQDEIGNKSLFINDIESLNFDKECVVATVLVCSELNSLSESTCTVGDKTIQLKNICDGIADCIDGSDETNCRDQVAESLKEAKILLLRMNTTFAENCQMQNINKTFSKRDKIYDEIKVLFDFVNDMQDNIKVNNETGNIIEIVKMVVGTLNKVNMNLSDGICAQQKNFQELIENARRYHRILDEDLEEVLRESALFPKSCLCNEGHCVSQTCVKSCKNACLLQYRLGRWSCPAVNGSASIHLNAICDGKFDCYDESDERECNKGNGRGKFEANEAFLQITKLLEMKMASKENEPVRNELLRLYNTIIKLQNLISVPIPKTRDVKIMRDRSFSLLSLVYGSYMRNTYNSNNAEEMYRFLNAINKILVAALKLSHTGNTKLISSYNCICRKGKCIKSQCSARCARACSVENKLTRYYCNESPENRSVSVESICNGEKNCALGDDESNCSAEVCRRHHLYALRLSLQDIGKERDGTSLGEILKFWRMKATSMLLVAENIGRPTPRFFRQTVRDILKDLVFAYASFETNRKSLADKAFQEFFDMSQKIIYALKTCGQYIGIFFLSVPASVMSVMFHWLEDDTFDCTVGIVVDDTPVAVGIFVNDRLVVTSANPLDNLPKHRIKIYAINGNPDSCKVVAIDYITTHSERISKRVRIGLDDRHSTVHDLTLISVVDEETVFSKHQSLPRRPYFLPLAETDATACPKGWSFAAFGFSNKRHVKNSNVLKSVVYRGQVMVDCNEYIPSQWGHFICIRNVNNFAGIQSGAPLLHQNVVYGVGSFSLTKNNDNILVFTDIRAYRGKLVYMYTKDWWWG